MNSEPGLLNEIVEFMKFFFAGPVVLPDGKPKRRDVEKNNDVSNNDSGWRGVQGSQQGTGKYILPRFGTDLARNKGYHHLDNLKGV